MWLVEYWPYALVLLSGGGLGVVLFLLFRPSDAPLRNPRRRSAARRRAGGRPRPDSGSAMAGEAALAKKSPVAAAAASPARMVREDVVRPHMPRPTAAEPVARAPGAGFAAAVQPAADPARDDLDFDIPSFLKRESEPAAVAPPLPPDPSLLPEGHPLPGGVGEVFFDLPRRMRPLADVSVVVRVRRTVVEPPSPMAVLARLHNAAVPESPPPLAVAVRLMGPDGAFRIAAPSPLLQLVDGRDGEWRFMLTPLAGGVHRLELAVAACKATGAQLEVLRPEPFGATVRVGRDYRAATRRALQIAIGALVVALITWLAVANAGAMRASAGAAAPRVVTPAPPTK